MAAAVQVRLEVSAFLGDEPALGEAEHLEAAAVGEDRARPSDEAMQAAAPRDQLVAGPQHQVIGVGEDDLGAGILYVLMPNRLDRALRADRHERGCLDDAVRRLEFAETRLAIGGSHRETESRHATILS